MDLFKLKYTYFRLLVLVLLIIIGAGYINSKEFKVLQTVGDFSIVSLLKGTTDRLVEFDEQGLCKEVKLQKTTIRCRFDPTITDPETKFVDATVKLQFEQLPLNIQDSLKSIGLDKYSVYYTKTFDINIGNAKAESISPLPRPGWGDTAFIIIYNARTGHALCAANYFNQPFGADRYSDLCSGGLIGLTKNEIYFMVANFEKAQFVYTGVPPYLMWSNPDIGTIESRLPGTENCFYYEWKERLDQAQQLQGIKTRTDVISNVDVSGQLVQNKDEVINKIKNPQGTPDVTIEFTEGQAPDVVESGSFIMATRLPLGFTWYHPYAYVEKSFLIAKPISYNGYLADCRFDEQRIVGYVKDVISENVCYFRSDAIETFVDANIGRNFPDGEIFCCDKQDCLIATGDVRYECKKDAFYCEKDADPVPEGCHGDDECQDKWWTRADGQDFFRWGQCENIDPKFGIGQCEYTDIAHDCNPDETYPADQCCKKVTGIWTLLSGEDCDPPGIKICEDYFGPNTCCLETQQTYSFHPCPGVLECCGAEHDGIGVCKESCGPPPPPPPTPILERFLQFIEDIFGTDRQIANIIVILMVILIILIVLKAIFPGVNLPFIRGPRGGGGWTGGTGGTGTGGPNVIVIR